MPDEADAKILTASPSPRQLEKTTEMSSHNMVEYYSAGPEIQEFLPEWSSRCGSETSALETVVYVWRYGLLVVHARKEEGGGICGGDALHIQEDALRQSESRAKDLEDERNRLQKTNAAQHSQLDKYKKMSEDSQSLAESLETQVSALKKVNTFALLLQKI